MEGRGGRGGGGVRQTRVASAGRFSVLSDSAGESAFAHGAQSNISTLRLSSKHSPFDSTGCSLCPPPPPPPPPSPASTAC